MTHETIVDSLVVASGFTFYGEGLLFVSGLQFLLIKILPLSVCLISGVEYRMGSWNGIWNGSECTQLQLTHVTSSN